MNNSAKYWHIFFELETTKLLIHLNLLVAPTSFGPDSGLPIISSNCNRNPICGNEMAEMRPWIEDVTTLRLGCI